MTVRVLALAASIMAAVSASLVFYRYGSADGVDAMDWVRAALILISTWWLAWGAAQGLLGLTTRPPHPEASQGPIRSRTVVLVPVYNEDPTVTFARIAAMDASVAAADASAPVDFAILSDTRKEDVARAEQEWFLRLLDETHGQGRIFYRRRAQNTGKKAGNIEEFIMASGGAYDFAVILDADSLMEGQTLIQMIRRMEAEPRLGLLQTLPKVIRARSVFGRTMQFSASFYSPIFARGLAMMQGKTGPFWGHNAIVRVRAFAESCGLPELRGKPPFGGHILSHDYVEAALLARAGWIVRLDDDLEGSFEEGPENMVDHAKRDRRWCQGNLQHSRLVGAPKLLLWSRFVFVQGIFAYVAPLFWLGFIGASIAAPLFAPPPDYFPEPHWSFPIFPTDEASQAIGLAIGVFGLLILPKLLIVLDAWGSGRARGFGGAARAAASTFCELLLSSVTAPVFLMYSTRSVLQVLSGLDGGWPANNRGDGSLTLAEGWAAGRWITFVGVIMLVGSSYLAPGLLLWILPVALPMIAAPWIIHRMSLPQQSGLFAVPQDAEQASVIALHDSVLARWTEEEAAAIRA